MFFCLNFFKVPSLGKKMEFFAKSLALESLNQSGLFVSLEWEQEFN